MCQSVDFDNKNPYILTYPLIKDFNVKCIYKGLPSVLATTWNNLIGPNFIYTGKLRIIFING